MKHVLLFVVLAAALLAPLAGCGGGSSGAPVTVTVEATTPDTTETESPPETSIAGDSGAETTDTGSAGETEASSGGGGLAPPDFVDDLLSAAQEATDAVADAAQANAPGELGAALVPLRLAPETCLSAVEGKPTGLYEEAQALFDRAASEARKACVTLRDTADELLANPTTITSSQLNALTSAIDDLIRATETAQEGVEVILAQ